MAVLNRTVRAGGVTYAAGTPESPELRNLIGPNFWSDGASASASISVHVDPAEIEELRRVAAEEIGKRDKRIAELEAAVERLTAENAAVSKQPAEPPRAGRGSGLEAWIEYAIGLGIDVPEAAGRDEVIDLVDASRSSV